MVAVAAALNGNLEKAGGRDYIAELAGTVRAPGHARHHAALIRAKADERGARQIGHGLTNGLAPEEAMERLRALRERSGTAEDWLGGEPMDPTLADGEPLPPLAGFPFLHAGAGAVISGPTGGGRSSLLQAAHTTRHAPGFGSPISAARSPRPSSTPAPPTSPNVAATSSDDERLAALARVRYLNLASTIARAYENPSDWVEEAAPSTRLWGSTRCPQWPPPSISTSTSPTPSS